MNIVTLWYTMNFIAEYQSRISSTVFKKYLSNSYDFFIKSDHAIFPLIQDKMAFGMVSFIVFYRYLQSLL